MTVESERAPDAKLPIPALGAALVLLTLAVFLPSLGNGFVWDDNWNVTANTTLRDGTGLVRIWSDPFANQQYYPLTHTSFWIQYQLFRVSPLPYHLVNLLLHAGSVLLLWTILRRLRAPGAWLAAAIFAVHPLQVESVAWVTERKNTLSGLLLMLSAYYVFRSAGLFDAVDEDREGGPRAGIQAKKRSKVGGLAEGAAPASAVSWAGVGLFALALAAKTAVATAPAALLAVFWWKRGRLRKADALVLAPLFALGIAAGLATGWLERHHVGAQGEVWSLGLGERLLLAGRVIWFYAGKFFLPFHQSFIYSKWDLGAERALGAAALGLALAVPAALIAARGRIGKGPAAAVLVYGTLLAPASGLFDVYFFRYAFVQDHFQYFAIIGLAALAAGALASLIARPEAFGAACALLLLPLVWISAGRQSAFKNAETLWRDTLIRNPSAVMAHLNLGNILFDRGDLGGAEEQYEAAARVAPRDAEALMGSARILAQRGRTDEAIARYREVLAINPAHKSAALSLGRLLLTQGRTEDALAVSTAAAAAAPEWADARLNRGIVLLRLSRTEEGLAEMREAARLDPESADIAATLGTALLYQGQAADALAQFDRAAAIGADPARAQFNRGLALGQLRRPQEAVNALRESIRLGGDRAEALNAIGDLLLAADKPGPALEQYTEAAAARPDFAPAHYGRGLALEHLARPREAVEAYREAIRYRADFAEARNNLAIALYTAGDYRAAWEEVHALQRMGGSPHPDFLQALTRAMPPPR